jgi:beta-1,2-mannobiose phosphorylase / 1,2-beta-oligomannan phosphorylase
MNAGGVNVWEKYVGNPVLGGKLGTCFDMSVSAVGGRYLMWFSWRPRHGIGLAESDDGLHWRPAPDVVLGPDPVSAVENQEVTRPYVLAEAGGYTMWYAGHSADRVVICRATSIDGRHWQRHGAVLEPQLPWEKAALMCPSVLRDEADMYHMWYSGGERYEPDAVGYATSPDGITWTRVGDQPVLGPDPGSAWERERVAGAHVFRRDGWFYIAYIGFANGFEDAAIGIARSADGARWHRHAGNPIISRGAPGDFDSINVYKPFVIVEGDLWRLWYNASSPRSGNDTSHDNRVEQVGYASCRFVFQPTNRATTGDSAS